MRGEPELPPRLSTLMAMLSTRTSQTLSARRHGMSIPEKGHLSHISARTPSSIRLSTSGTTVARLAPQQPNTAKALARTVVQ